MPPILRPPTRRVKCNDPRIMQHFNDSYLQFLIDHKLHDQAFRLEAQASYPLSPQLQREAEKLDRLRMEGVAYADHRCRKLHMGGVPFSIEFKMMDAKVGFGNAMIHRKSGKKVSSHFLQCLIKKAGISERLSAFSGLSKDELLERRSKAYRDYRHFVEQQSVIARANWLEDLAEARAAAALKQQESDSKRIRSSRYSKQLKPGQTTISKATDTELRQLRDRERLRTTAKRVKVALGSGRASGVTMISLPDEDNVNGPWIERSSQADIEAGCRWEKQRRFSQTNRMLPPMIQPLRSQLGFLGISPDAKDVLDGSF
jgi:ATP/maltotriose-dependent transcriptional regulator MalT